MTVRRPGGTSRVRAWDPHVPGVAEVFHAHVVEWGYPMHTHDAWSVLIVDEGAIDYSVDVRSHQASGDAVAVLPPGIAHDGRPSARAGAYRKRILYLDADVLPVDRAGVAADLSVLSDAPLRSRLSDLHRALVGGASPLEAESRLALVADRMSSHLLRREPGPLRPVARAAALLRERIDDDVAAPHDLGRLASELGCSTAHLIRSFARAYGLPPHAYLVNRRVDAARRLLRAGRSPAEVATSVGFFDQAHLTRHFKRYTSTTPGAFAASSR